MDGRGQIERFWAEFDERLARDGVRGVRGVVDAISAGLSPAESAFERAGVRDATGETGEAVDLYREALAVGLDPDRRTQAVIQLASSLRELGRAEEVVALLEPELGRCGNLDDAVRAFLALAYADTGRTREGLAMALAALSSHLPRYRRSIKNYAQLLRDEVPRRRHPHVDRRAPPR